MDFLLMASFLASLIFFGTVSRITKWGGEESAMCEFYLIKVKKILQKYQPERGEWVLKKGPSHANVVFGWPLNKFDPTP